MIKVQKLVKKYGNFKALKGVSFKVDQGEVYSLLGSNGAGKTTIIKIITGLLEATSGDALIDGKNINDGTNVKKLFGYMPEEPHLYDRLTGREFLMMMGSLRGIEEDTLKGKVEELADILELDRKIDSEMGAYSKGMKQKILFANAIIHDPPNLILDEPTTGLDPRFTRYIKDRIKQFSKEGKTVLMSTHITSVAADISDKVAIINGGKIIIQGKLKSLLKSTNTIDLEELFIKVVNDERRSS